MADLLRADFGLAVAHKLYACHDLLLQHKADLFSHLMARWRDLFSANFDVLLYDLTSTYPRVKPKGMLRDQRLGRGGGRQAPPRLRPRQAAGLPAGGDRAGGHHGRSSLGLQGAARQHGGLHDDTDVPRQSLPLRSAAEAGDRAAVRPRAARLGDGSRHPHRSGAGGDARQRSAGAVSGGNAERASPASGERPACQTLAAGARRRGADCCPRTTNFMSEPVLGRAFGPTRGPRVSIATARNARCASGR